jgi:hypothetical protein
MRLVGQHKYVELYLALNETATRAVHVLEAAGMTVLHTHYRAQGSTVIAVEDPSGAVCKKMKKKGHKLGLLFAVAPDEPARCQTGWQLSLTLHALRDINGRQALDIFLEDVVASFHEVQRSRSLALLWRLAPENTLLPCLVSGNIDAYLLPLLNSGPGAGLNFIELLMKGFLTVQLDSGSVASAPARTCYSWLRVGTCALLLLPVALAIAVIAIGLVVLVLAHSLGGWGFGSAGAWCTSSDSRRFLLLNPNDPFEKLWCTKSALDRVVAVAALPVVLAVGSVVLGVGVTLATVVWILWAVWRIVRIVQLSTKSSSTDRQSSEATRSGPRSKPTSADESGDTDKLSRPTRSHSTAPARDVQGGSLPFHTLVGRPDDATACFSPTSSAETVQPPCAPPASRRYRVSALRPGRVAPTLRFEESRQPATARTSACTAASELSEVGKPERMLASTANSILSISAV